MNWFLELDAMARVSLIVGAVSTVCLIVQVVLSLIGADTDGDLDVDIGDADGFADLQFFSVRTVLSFFCTFGWIGFTVMQTTGKAYIAAPVAVAAGAAVMLLVAFLLRAIGRLQSDGTRRTENAVGLTGTVYLTVPAARSGKGKVNLILQGSFAELDAVTDGDRELSYGAEVKVIGVLGDETLVVAGALADDGSEQ